MNLRAEDTSVPVHEGTRRMVERLQSWLEISGPNNPFDQTQRLPALMAQVNAAKDPRQRVPLEYKLAWELLNAGKPQGALIVVSNVLRDAWAFPGARTQARSMIWRLQGLAYLRLGELENCLHHHNPESCLFPIQGGGKHGIRRGGANAEEIFARLSRHPRDLGSRWLYNIAAMTQGHYPDGVPEAHRLPESILKSEYQLSRFPEIATQVGLAEDALAGASITEDFDGDGLLDVFASSWNVGNPCRYFKNLGNGKFEDRSARAGLTGLTGGLNAMQTDYNNDGWPDIYILRGAWLDEVGRVPNSLLRNNGDGTFADVTEEVGLLTLLPALSAVWFDANNDGWLDLFVGNETINPENPRPTQLFLNDGSGRFRDVAREAGAALTSFIRGVTAGDHDNDGWTDLYVSSLFSDNVLLRNEGASGEGGLRFTDATARLKVAQPKLSFPTWFWDYNNDGWLDLLVCGYGSDNNVFSSGSQGHDNLNEVVADKLGRPTKSAKIKLYQNTGNGGFRDVTVESSLDHAVLAMGANFGDLDNDGYLDCYFGTGMPYFGSLLPNEMFRNDRGKRFQNVTTSGGFGHLQKGHGISFADLNNDGHQDVFLNVGGAYPGDNYFDALFANPGNANNWITLKLVGTRSNRAAIGARIKVVAGEGERTFNVHRVVGSGGSFGASPLRQEIGLGTMSRVDRVEVWWPVTGQTNVLRDLAPRKAYRVEEGSNIPTPIKHTSFAWPGS